MKKTILTTIAASIFFAANAGQGVMYYKSGFPDVAKSILISDLKTDPATKAETCFYLGNVYFLESQPDSAAYYFNEGLAADAAYPMNSIGLVMLKMKSTDAKTVDAEIKKIVNDKNFKAYKKDANLYVAIGYAFLYNKLNNKAQEYQSTAQSVSKSRSADAFVLWGDILAEHNLGAACANYETAIMYDPDCIEAYIKYARAYKNANPKLAIDKLMQLKQIAPTFVLTDRELGDIYYAKNDFGQAAQYYDTYLKSGNKTDAGDLVRYSMTLFMNHDYNKSLAVASSGLVANPRHPALNRLVMYNDVELKQYDAALSAANLLFNGSDNAKIDYLDYRYYAEALKSVKKTELAAAAFKKALEIDATKVDLWKEISDVYSGAKDYAKAISAYETYIKNVPADTLNNNIALGTLYYNYGIDTLALADERQAALLKADGIFGTVAEQYPDDYRGNFWRARANLALDQTGALAKPYYEKTIELILPKNDARYNSALIECYSLLGAYYFQLEKQDLQSSLDNWKKILELNPDHANAKLNVAYLEGEIKNLKKKK
jgi:tetratricopeptide (TPR) repeat protein